MRNDSQPTVSFGVFDHLDEAGGSLRQQYTDRLQIASACDLAGFRAYHVAEHHGTPHGMAGSPNVFLSAVAQRTTRMRIGPLVMLLSLYHPLRAFEEICMLDQLSGGRLDLGIGRGAAPLELSFFGVSMDQAQGRYSEAVDIILQAMDAEMLSYDGHYFKLDNVPITLSPFQRPHPPLWYGASKPETALWAAEKNINIACVGQSAAIRTITDAYRSRWNATSAESMPLLGMVRTVVIANSYAEAAAIAAPAYTHWLKTFTHLSRSRGFPAPPNVPASFEQALDEGVCLVGSTSTVRDALKKQVSEAGVTYVMCHLAFGDLPLAASLDTISAVQSEIMPAFSVGQFA